MSADSAETLYLLDAHSLIYQVFHAIAGMTSPAGLPTNAVFGFTRDLFFIRDKKPTRMICVFDAPGRTFRDDIYPEYKAHRAPMPDDLQLQIPMIHELLAALRIPVISQQGVEADDLIATLAHLGDQRGMNVFICSSDKDCRQLLTSRVAIYNLRKRELYQAEALMKDWGVTPEQVIDYQTLVGDSVDNVPGVDGVGPKTACQYLQKYGSLDNLLAHLDDLPPKKREKIEQAKAHLPISKSLVTLKTDLPLDTPWDEWTLKPWDAPKLLDLFRGWGFHRFQEEIRHSMPASSMRDPAAPPPTSSQPTQRDLFSDLPDTETPTDAVPLGEWKHTYHLVNDAPGLAKFLAKLKEQARFAIDLETTSLEAHSADIVGIAISWQAEVAWYVALRGPAGETSLDPAEVLAQLKPILENAAIAKVNQNIKYDCQVFKNAGIELVGIAGDTMVADYLLNAGDRGHNLDALSEKHLNHRPIPITDLIGKGKNAIRMDQVPVAKVAEYAGEDADIAWRLCQILEPLLEGQGFKKANTAEPFALYDDLEIPLIGVLADMEFTGIRLDVDLLNGMSKTMAEDLDRLEADIYRLAGRSFNIASVKQLRGILFDELGYKPSHRTAITKAASTDQETLEDLARQGHELPRKLLDHRKIAKLKSTYVDALPALVHPKTGRVHASFNQTVAATGRLSSSEPNLQNIPIRSELGGQIRQAFVPREGWKLIAADYSQIELRFLAHFSKDEALRQAFADDVDIHTLVASQVFGVPLEDVNAEQRRMAKTVNFGVIYGMSSFGLADRLEIDKDDAGRFIDAYFQRYPRVLAYQDQLLDTCLNQGYVATLLGRRRAITGIRSKTTYKSRNQPEREAINMQIQGSAADLIKVAMLNLHARLNREKMHSKLLLQIHDELVLEAPPEEIESTTAIVREEMTNALRDRLEVPLGIDIGVGANWLEVK